MCECVSDSVVSHDYSIRHCQCSGGGGGGDWAI